MKWPAKAILIIVSLIILFAGYFYWEAYQLRKDYDVARIQNVNKRVPSHIEISVPLDSTLIARGKRLSQTLHCTYCHGDQLQGRETEERVGPNITKVRHQYSNAELVKAIRYGINKDGTAIGGDMPSSESYYHLNDTDTKALIAYIRSLPDLSNVDLPSTYGHTLSTTDLIRGGFAHVFLGWEPDVDEYIYSSPMPARPSDGDVIYGRYLAQTHCTRCHGEDLSGEDSYWQTADLAVGAGYSTHQFKTLLRQGKALGGREIGFMTKLAKGYLSHLTDSEIQAIHSYLKKRAGNYKGD